MNQITLRIDGDRTAFRPGETITGTVRWALEEAPSEFAVRLFWYTRGKGTEDVGVVDEVPVTVGDAAGEQTFSFRLPAGPYSFSGRLISLMWSIEAVSAAPEAVDRVDLVVSPTLVEVLVQPLGEAASS